MSALLVHGFQSYATQVDANFIGLAVVVCGDGRRTGTLVCGIRVLLRGDT